MKISYRKRRACAAYDDQSQMKIALETQAKLHIQSLVRIGAIKLTWSYMLDYENSKNPYEENKIAIFTWRNIAASFVKNSNEQIVNFAQQMQFQYGVKKFDGNL